MIRAMEEKIKVDLTSATDKQIEVVDNSGNHTPTSYGGIYRITSRAINRESYDSLTSKSRVDQEIPNLFDVKGGLQEGTTTTVEVATFSGTHEFTFGIKQNGENFYLTGTAGDSEISVLLPRTLLKFNKHGEQADMTRAVLMLMTRCLNLAFWSFIERERGFRKLRKYLWP